MKTIKARITGTRPLLMHNGHLADPLNPIAKEIKKVTGKRNKTDEDHYEIARLEVLGGLYLDENSEPCIPARVLWGVICGKGGAARRMKSGTAAKAGISISGNFPLEYDGPRDPAEIVKCPELQHRELVTVQRSRVARTWPFFKEWAAVIEVSYNTDYVNDEEIRQWLNIAGTVGIGDYRPSYGTFSVKILDE